MQAAERPRQRPEAAANPRSGRARATAPARASSAGSPLEPGTEAPRPAAGTRGEPDIEAGAGTEAGPGTAAGLQGPRLAAAAAGHRHRTGRRGIERLRGPR